MYREGEVMSVISSEIGYFGIPKTKKAKKTQYIAFKIISDTVKGYLGALTFSNMKEEVSARWNSHYMQNRKPYSEFVGTELIKISLTIELNSSLLHPLKTTPFKIRNKLIKLCNNGTTGYLVIGGHKMSSRKFKILSVSDDFDIISRGTLKYTKDKFQKITCNVVFEEV